MSKALLARVEIWKWLTKMHNFRHIVVENVRDVWMPRGIALIVGLDRIKGLQWKDLGHDGAWEDLGNT